MDQKIGSFKRDQQKYLRMTKKLPLPFPPPPHPARPPTNTHTKYSKI